MNISELKEVAQYTLSRLKEYGADEAQCKVQFGVVDEINVDAGEFSLMRSTFDSAVTMKVIKDMKKGVIAINKIDKIEDNCWINLVIDGIIWSYTINDI